MSKVNKSIAANCKLNKEWATHVKKEIKRLTSKIRRQVGKKLCVEWN